MLGRAVGGCLLRCNWSNGVAALKNGLHGCLRSTAATSELLACSTRTPESFARRTMSIFNRVTADQLWAGCSSVSNAGKKRGRGKRGATKKKTNLNIGRPLGQGALKAYMWPGLNAPVMKGREVFRLQEVTKNKGREEELAAQRDEQGRKKRNRVATLERGWSGSSYPGMSVGPPDPIGDATFEEFDTRVLEFKLVTTMTGNMGRKQRHSCFVVVGNGKGLAGFGLAKANSGPAALRKAKNRAVQRLQHVELYDGHTIFHNTFTKEGHTGIFMYPKPRGYGLVGHRALVTICKTIGISDLYARVEGRSKNIQNLTKAFFAGLSQQEKPQQLADRMGYNVVEIKSEMDGAPRLIASPSSGSAVSNKPLDNTFDLQRLYFGGKTQYVKPKQVPFYEKLPSWERKAAVLYRNRNQPASQIQRLANVW